MENNCITASGGLVAVQPGASRVVQTDLGAEKPHLEKQSRDGITQASLGLDPGPSRHPLSVQGAAVADPETLGRRAR